MYMANLKVDLRTQDYKELRKQIDHARGSLSATLKSRLLTLVGALEAPETDPQRSTDKKLLKEWDSNEPHVRTPIANLRRALKNRIWTLPSGRACVLGIPVRDNQPYRLEVTVPPAPERFWAPHLTNSDRLEILLFQRLFFRYGNNTYIRNTSTSGSEQEARETTLGDLPKSITSQKEWASFKKSLQPSLHYASSGELAGAILLQDVFQTEFLDFLGSHVRLAIDNSKSGNQIVLAAPVVQSPDMVLNDNEAFIARADGVYPRNADDSLEYQNRIEADQAPFLFRSIHLLLTRKVQDGSVRTILQGGHGRSIEGVCKRLASREALTNLIEQMNLGDKILPAQFQIVFQVRLVYDPRDMLSRATRVTPVKWASAGDIQSFVD